MRKLSRFKRLGRLPVLVAALASCGLAAASLAVADNLVADGDGFGPVGDNNMAFGNVNCGQATQKTVLLGIKRSGTGTNVFKNGTTADITVQSVTGSSGVSSTIPGEAHGDITLPSDWTAQENNTIAPDTVSATVTVNSSVPGSHTGEITYKATGLNGSNGSIERTDAMTVTWTTGSCAPANQAPTAPGKPSASASPNQGVFDLAWTGSTDPDGNPVTYTLEHKDADDSAYSQLASGLSGSPYSFTSGSEEAEGTWTYRAKASDGTASSGYSPESEQVVVDRSAPSDPTASTDRPAEYGDWFKNTVTVSYAGSTDPTLQDTSSGSGVAGYAGAQTFTTSGSHAYSGTASDNAGNESPATRGSVKVDADDPSVHITGCQTGTTVTLGSSPTVAVAASDGQSGIDSANDPTATGVALDTSTIGQKTRSFTAKDNVGHEKTESCVYTVVYDFTGFFQPVDMGGVFNKAKAGSAIPVKFSLDGTPVPGSNTPADGGAPPVVTPVISYQIACPTSTAQVDTLEETVAASQSGLKYDPAADQWVYVWKTSTALASKCQRLDVTLADGTKRSAKFQFTK